MMQKLDYLIPQAYRALALDVPYYRAEIHGDVLILWLYGHTQPVTWQHTVNHWEPVPEEVAEDQAAATSPTEGSGAEEKVAKPKRTNVPDRRERGKRTAA